NAQALSGQPQKSMAVPAPKVDAAKHAAIKSLLDAIDAPKLASAIGESLQMQSKQLVPVVLSEALTENKSLNDQQKQASVPTLQKDAVPKLTEQAGKVFT